MNSQKVFHWLLVCYNSICCRNWRFQQMGLEMLELLIRHDVPFPANGVRIFVKNMLHDMLLIRKVSCIHTLRFY